MDPIDLIDQRITISYSIRDAARILRSLRTEQRDHEMQGIDAIIYKALADDLERRITAIMPLRQVHQEELKATKRFCDYVLGKIPIPEMADDDDMLESSR